MDYVSVEKSSKYDVGFHEFPLITAWMVLANLTILVGAVKWHKYSFYIHTLLGLIIISLTLMGTLHVLFEVGIGYNPTKRFQTLHNTIGLIVVIWLSLQFITGIFSRIIQYSSIVSSNVCKWTKRVHQFSSYFIMVLAKFQYLIIYYRRSKYADILGFILFDFVCIAMYLWLKFKYPKLSETIIQSQLKFNKKEVDPSSSETGFLTGIQNRLVQIKDHIFKKQFKIPQIKYLPVVYQSQREIPISNYFLFNDYVYELDPIQQIHPGGQKIISLINKRQVDRFMFGFHPLQMSSDLITHKHSADSLRICGQPIARIQRMSPMKNIPDYMNVKLSYCQKINPNNSVYLIHLQSAVSLSQNWIQFEYQGFTHQKQIGQYFTLSVCDQQNNTVTRLYTSIWCLRPKNIEFMEKQFPGSTKNKYQQLENKQFLVEEEIKFQKQEVIPLVIKRYEDGQMTSKFLETQFQGQMILSKPLGGGLKYNSLQSSGKVIIICGGTGLMPFIDLIDLLFKRVKYLEKSNISGILAESDPLIKEDIIMTRQFILYFACQYIEDVYPLTLHQINCLNHSRFILFKSFVRVRHMDKNNLNRQYQNITFQTNKFDDQVNQHLQSRFGICKIYICGPPAMNLDISKTLTNNKISSDLYHFV